MKTNWKTKLKSVLDERRNFGTYLNSTLTKGDETDLVTVLSSFVSGQLVDTPENFIEKQIISPSCSNCNLEMKFTENGNLWFCPFGCESRAANKTQ
jgi:hypothetical protein